MSERKRAIRCAIYTRKSSEEGLDQTFNSLDAQREACEAYVLSQRHEGWTTLPQQYDDGGFSGGSLERPALQALLRDIRSGKVDLVVVYKIDRLTRSLTDFSEMVAVFDQHQASFVSITQHFNTTTSMGRLTLNVLLSFAQFEREVTGERIRDKIAASKRKGMWMGGSVPVGYDSVDRRLIVNEAEAEQVRHVFDRYHQVGCVAALKSELDASGVVSKQRISVKGNAHGARSYSRGALYQLLKNRVYCGEIPHKGTFYPGQHAAIVPQELWDAVQAQLETNRDARRLGSRARHSSLLAGMVTDGQGARFTPSHTLKSNRRYRYYLGREAKETLGQKSVGGTTAPRLCVPAHALEAVVTREWLALLGSEDLDSVLEIEPSQADQGRELRDAAQGLSTSWGQLSLAEQRRWLLGVDVRVVIHPDSVIWSCCPSRLQDILLRPEQTATSPLPLASRDDERLTRMVAAKVTRSGGEVRILLPDGDTPLTADSRHATLLRTIAKAQRWYQQLTSGAHPSLAAIARAEGVTRSYVVRLFPYAFLAPDLVQELMEGKAPPTANLAGLLRKIPSEWSAQRRLWTARDKPGRATGRHEAGGSAIPKLTANSASRETG